MEVVMLPPDNEGKNINNLPSLGYRSMSFSRMEDNQYMLTYLLRSSEGVYSPILRSEGSDRTFPEYTGGSAAQFWFIRQNMQYPEKAADPCFLHGRAGWLGYRTACLFRFGAVAE